MSEREELMLIIENADAETIRILQEAFIEMLEQKE